MDKKLTGVQTELVERIYARSTTLNGVSKVLFDEIFSGKDTTDEYIHRCIDGMKCINDEISFLIRLFNISEIDRNNSEGNK